MLVPLLSRSFAEWSVHKLAAVDYTVANRVTDDVARFVSWAYENDHPRLAAASVDALQFFDNFGSLLICAVAWIVHHTA